MGINIKKRPSSLFWLYAHVCVKGGGGTCTKMSADREEFICQLNSQFYHQTLII